MLSCTSVQGGIQREAMCVFKRKKNETCLFASRQQQLGENKPTNTLQPGDILQEGTAQLTWKGEQDRGVAHLPLTPDERDEEVYL